MIGIVSFAQNHTVIVIILGLGLLFFVYRKPKLFLFLLFLGLLVGGLFYMVTSISRSGLEHKRTLIPEEQEQSNSNP
jgi:hypothetical protein